MRAMISVDRRDAELIRDGNRCSRDLLEKALYEIIDELNNCPDRTKARAQLPGR